MFLPKKKGDVYFPARKAADERSDERWGVVRCVCVAVLFCCRVVGEEPLFGKNVPASNGDYCLTTTRNNKNPVVD
jgi:hypothetical protein